MSDDQNMVQDADPESDSLPTSSEEPAPPSYETSEGQGELASQSISPSEPAEVSPETLEAPQNSFEVKSPDIPLPENNAENEIPEDLEEVKIEEIPLETTASQADPVSNGTGGRESSIENIPTSSEPSEEPKAQTSKIEPLNERELVESEPLAKNEKVEPKPRNLQKPELVEDKPVNLELKPEPTSQKSESKPVSEEKIQSSQKIESIQKHPPVSSQPVRNRLKELQVKEFLGLKKRTERRLEKVMSLFAKNEEITNDKVEKSLRVSDATATRYLSQLVKEGKIRRNGKRRGRYVSYSRV